MLWQFIVSNLCHPGECSAPLVELPWRKYASDVRGGVAGTRAGAHFAWERPKLGDPENYERYLDIYMMCAEAKRMD
jgi:hypothetical protein